MLRRRWKVAALWLIAIGAIYYLFGPSQAFQDCISQHQSAKPYQTPQEEGGFFVKAPPLARLNIACGFVSANENNGAIAALAAVVVAIFTCTLWRATSRLWVSAENQLTEFRASLVQAQANANVQADHMASYVAQATLLADAARKSADTAEKALVTTERAFVFLKEMAVVL
jgi:hypothetical protein